MKKPSVSFVLMSLALLCFLSLHPTSAQGVIQETPSGADTEVPVTAVSLFSSGVGYFQREVRVDGSGALQFHVNTADMNDLLKSMVIRDLDGGSILGMNYASQDPISRALAAFAVNLSGNPSVQQILTQLRGERVEVTASDRIDGTILGIETRRVAARTGTAAGGSTVPVDLTFLDLYTQTGIRSISLDEIQSIRFVRPELDREFRLALGVIAANRNNDQKQVAIRYAGTGKRRLLIGYLQEMPVWKTSYRLSIDRNSIFMQGWALVENTTDQDWRNVRLNLVAGQPVSFTMDLYTPIYLKRPEVSLGFSQAPVPPAYQQNLTERAAPSAAPRALSKAAPAPSMASSEAAGAEPGFSLSDGVSSAAVAAEAGAFFQYTISQPVSIGRRESAMVPIVNQKVEGELLSIYNEGVDAKHPFNGMRLKNSTGLYLNAGPITVFQDGQYAGDSRIENVSPGGERLLSFSVDLSTEVSSRSSTLPELIESVRIQKGTLLITRKLRRERKYMIRYDGTEPRQMLIEYPLSTAWKLTSPQTASEETRSYYRFLVPLAPSSSREFTVSEERTLSQSISLSSSGLNTIEIYQRSSNVSPALKAALSRLVQMRNELSTIQRDSSETNRQLQQIYSDQRRIRENMSALDRTSALYNRYVATLSSQENQIADLTRKLDDLKKRENEKRGEIERFLSNLNVE